MIADLHIHTTASDGTQDPATVIKVAKEAKLTAVAITDHDTTAGIKEALTAGKCLNIEVIPGIELSTEINNTEIHILGYYIEYNNDSFQDTIAQVRLERYYRAKKMVELLNNMGIKINFDDVVTLAGGDENIGRPHIARLMYKEGYTESFMEAFERYIGIGCPAYIPRTKLSPLNAIKLIRSVQGIPVLAHPAYKVDDSYILELVKTGLLGIEVYHPEHDEEMQRHYDQLARKNNLLITGGSDYHGPEMERKRNIGASVVPYVNVIKLKNVKSRISMQ